MDPLVSLQIVVPVEALRTEIASERPIALRPTSRIRLHHPGHAVRPVVRGVRVRQALVRAAVHVVHASGGCVAAVEARQQVLVH